MAKLHRPGRPDDLPDARLLWTRWAAVAVATYDRDQEREPAQHRYGYWIDDDGLHWDDCGCTWWVFQWYGDGRAVLVGEDESSKVKTHEPAIDLLAGSPEWLPRQYLQGLIDDYMVGCVYWFDDGAWHRAPYPDDLADDGLDCGISSLTTREGAVGEIAERLEFDATDAGMPELCDQLLDAAERGTVTENVLRSFADSMTRLTEQHYPGDDSRPRTDDDIAAMFALARRAGLDTAAWTGTLGVRS
ncbi:hypothetical protein ACFYV7_37690 [Nocardia suismassiliense]|uniref:Uncharacterized protein n=1 Tax=Nocardia suismassiliense TaxID=2077092 RepID=A0ABW6R513_9NOCA